MRAFAQSAKIRHRGCSRPLQRAITDLGADQPFAQVMDKLVEHYGILVNESTIRRVTQHHARAIFERRDDAGDWPDQPGYTGTIVAEMDGGMVPVVEPDATQSDRRKGKTLQWKEAKICLAHRQGSKTLSYGGTLQGSVAQAGQQLFDCARQAGWGTGTQVHAVGDGAPWIADQVENQFGAQSRYLLDFYHVCDYLSAAAQAINTDPATQETWLDAQKERLKTRRVPELLQTLERHREAPDINDSDAPVRQCHRYLSQRLEQLNYQAALEAGLPIGSGEIESAHRYLVQQRLKRPGAWWREANAEHMLALRLNRANRQWDAYWAADTKQAA